MVIRVVSVAILAQAILVQVMMAQVSDRLPIKLAVLRPLRSMANVIK